MTAFKKGRSFGCNTIYGDEERGVLSDGRCGGTCIAGSRVDEFATSLLYCWKPEASSVKLTGPLGHHLAWMATWSEPAIRSKVTICENENSECEDGTASARLGIHHVWANSPPLGRLPPDRRGMDESTTCIGVTCCREIATMLEVGELESASPLCQWHLDGSPRR